MRKVLLFLLILLASINVLADKTNRGKIVYTQGHVSPNCRIVQMKENDSGQIHYFRISDVQGNDDINSVVLAALMANRDVDVVYDPEQTTGCGNEPKILYITVY